MGECTWLGVNIVQLIMLCLMVESISGGVLKDFRLSNKVSMAV
jgi:hypothetical protein